MMSGEVMLLVEDLESKARENVLLLAGDIIFIQTGVVDALQVTKSGHAIEFSIHDSTPQIFTARNSSEGEPGVRPLPPPFSLI